MSCTGVERPPAADAALERLPHARYPACYASERSPAAERLLNRDYPECYASDEQLERACLARAKVTYPTARARFLSGLPKATIFAVIPNDGHGFVVVERIANGQITGRSSEKSLSVSPHFPSPRSSIGLSSMLTAPLRATFFSFAPSSDLALGIGSLSDEEATDDVAPAGRAGPASRPSTTDPRFLSSNS